MTQRNKKAHTAAAMMMGAILHKAFSEVLNETNSSKEGVVDVPADGTAVELPIKDGFEVFISEDGKPMIRKKADGDAENANGETRPTTYDQVAERLYKNVSPFYWNINTNFEIESVDTYCCAYNHDAYFNCKTMAQVKRLMAFNKLQNIAKYLNDGWKPNFNSCSEQKFFIMCTGYDKYAVGINTLVCGGDVYFKTEASAKQAIGIMGRESLRDLFNVNW